MDDILFWTLSRIGLLSGIWFGIAVLAMLVGGLYSWAGSKKGARVFLGGVVILFFGFVLLIVLMVMASTRPAPPSWFRHVPPSEAAYFRNQLDSRHRALSINRFVLIEEEYPAHQRAKQEMVRQKDELTRQRDDLARP